MQRKSYTDSQPSKKEDNLFHLPTDLKSSTPTSILRRRVRYDNIKTKVEDASSSSTPPNKNNLSNERSIVDGEWDEDEKSKLTNKQGIRDIPANITTKWLFPKSNHEKNTFATKQTKDKGEMSSQPHPDFKKSNSSPLHNKNEINTATSVLSIQSSAKKNKSPDIWQKYPHRLKNKRLLEKHSRPESKSNAEREPLLPDADVDPEKGEDDTNEIELAEEGSFYNRFRIPALESMRGSPKQYQERALRSHLRPIGDGIPEVHFIGEIRNGVGFSKRSSSVSCKFTIEWGMSWSYLDGEYNGQTQYSMHQNGAACIWNHPIDIHFASANMKGWPRLIIQVWELDDYGRTNICGYGFAHLPSAPGCHDIDAKCWIPCGSIMDELHSYFLGTATQLKDTDLIFNKAWDQRHRLVSAPTGSVRIYPPCSWIFHIFNSDTQYFRFNVPFPFRCAFKSTQSCDTFKISQWIFEVTL
mmetsp:Transcript_22513/g.31748  ORF Transcript_22513/g.31748 Transcript_22513/m.31748 type:complete len:469 (-) Transcript_22513:385-1791(-)